MTTCRLPLESHRKLAAHGIACTPENLARLAQFCSSRIAPSAAPWTFAPHIAVPLPAGAAASQTERSLVAWAMARETDWSWNQTIPAHAWRPEQQTILARSSTLRPGAIGVLEASTGVGKTRAYAAMAAAESANTRIVIAVPTLAVGRQWQEAWKLFSASALTEVWGKSQYGDDVKVAAERQAHALDACAMSSTVLCTHQMIPKALAASQADNMLFVDEAHLLSASITSLAGQFYPASALGQWIQRWSDQQTLPGTDTEEIEVSGRMRELIIRRLVPEPARQHQWRASIITRQDSEPLVWIRHATSTDAVLASLWEQTGRAILFSGTLSWQTCAGVRSIQHLARRLAIPAERLQDLGRVRPEWRDEGVTVLRPAAHMAADKKPWLGAYRGREEQWWPEAARALLTLRMRPGKTLVLANSYADIEGVRAAMGRVAGVVASQRGESIDEGIKALGRKAAWCWLATGAAWTGMDATVGLQRVVVLKLPLPDPHAMRLLAHPQDAVFDAVSRFRQGVGRLVRAAGGQGLEIIVLDGRINDPSPRWRRICQPFMQVLGEDFEHHETLDISP